MERRSDHPTDVLAKQRIERRITVWAATNPEFYAEYQVPLIIEGEETRGPSILLTHTDAAGTQWYVRYVLLHLLLDWIASGDEKQVNRFIDNELKRLRIEIEEMQRGADPAT